MCVRGAGDLEERYSSGESSIRAGSSGTMHTRRSSSISLTASRWRPVLPGAMRERSSGEAGAPALGEALQDVTLLGHAGGVRADHAQRPPPRRAHRQHRTRHHHLSGVQPRRLRQLCGAGGLPHITAVPQPPRRPTGCRRIASWKVPFSCGIAGGRGRTRAFLFRCGHNKVQHARLRECGAGRCLGATERRRQLPTACAWAWPMQVTGLN